MPFSFLAFLGHQLPDEWHQALQVRPVEIVQRPAESLHQRDLQSHQYPKPILCRVYFPGFGGFGLFGISSAVRFAMALITDSSSIKSDPAFSSSMLNLPP